MKRHRWLAASLIAAALAAGYQPGARADAEHPRTNDPVEVNVSPADARPQARWWSGPCKGLSVRRTIVCAVARWPVGGGASYAIAIAERESGLVPSAVSPSGTYVGVFQIGRYHMPTWPANVMRGPWWHRWFPLLRFTDANSLLKGRFNVLLAIRVAHLSGWGPWSRT